MLLAKWLICLLAFAGVAQADTITVTTNSGGTGGPDCTLRDAITAANLNTPIGGCPGGNGADTIELPAGATIELTEVDYEAQGNNGLEPIASTIAINGNGATILRSLAEGTPYFRIFFVSGELVLNNVTVANGNAFGQGADGVGGGFFIHFATAELTDITVSGNTASAGGGIVVQDCYKVSLTDCLISENSAGGLGGGIIIADTDMSLTNTIVCGNTPDQIFGDPWTDNGGNVVSDDCTPCQGDFNGDDEVGPVDLAYLLAFWGPCFAPCEPGDPFLTCLADLTGDCAVGAADLAQLLASWGPCP